MSNEVMPEESQTIYLLIIRFDNKLNPFWIGRLAIDRKSIYLNQ